MSRDEEKLESVASPAPPAESDDLVATTPDALEAALAEVAHDAAAGLIPDLDAGVDAVIMRVVALQFGHLPEHKRQRLLLHVHELLHNDPLFKERVARLLNEQS